MPAGLENLMTLHMVNQKDKSFSRDAAVPNTKLDLDVFGAKEIRDVLKSRAHCLRAGFPANHVIIATLNEIRDHYILKVGLPTYLSQMLGELGKAPIQNAILYDQAEQPIKLDLTNSYNQPLQRFIAKRFHWDNLPFTIAVHKEGDPERVEYRYL